MNLKSLIKNHAYELGADLVGVGNIERCEHAPRMMSPQGLFPGCRSIIVMAVHHPDACIELGGEKHPQDIGPYDVQYLMNNRLDEMSYRMGTFLEKQGCNAVPIAASNIWRYNQYKDLKAIFAPDVSNIYMAVVAGLADLGYNGLALTPEYGARNRFITVLTDAELDPDPLIPPGTVCDKCMLCRKYCPTEAFDKEVDGENVLRIDGHEYRFPKKNLWRCSWGEHFDLDLDLDIPDVVNEQVILEYVEKYGTRSGEMGQCLKFCLPANLRTKEPEYSRTPVRKLPVVRDPAIDSRATFDRLLSAAAAKGGEYIIVNTAAELAAAGVSIEERLPGAEAAITVLMVEPEASPDALDEATHSAHARFHWGATYTIDSICYDLTRELEKLGYRSVMTVRKNPGSKPLLEALGISFGNRHVYVNTVVTRAPMGPMPFVAGPSARKSTSMRRSLRKVFMGMARKLGADLAGVSSAHRLKEIAEQVRPVFEGQTVLDASGRGHFSPWKPEISERTRTVLAPEDYVPGAKSVFVFGMRIPAEVVRRAGKPPAEAAGPYAFQTYATNWVGSVIGVRLVKELESMGYRAAMTMDLLNTASFTGNPRGSQPDSFSNRFAAVAAGLGWLTVNARAVTPEFGLRQRFVAIVTDAEMDESPVRSPGNGAYLCRDCERMCISACPSGALRAGSAEIVVDGKLFTFNHIDNLLCDWTKRYALMRDCGFKCLGSETDIDPEGEVTKDKLASALPQLDPIKNIRPVVVEPCYVACPYAAGE